jgi:hypothetical protein
MNAGKIVATLAVLCSAISNGALRANDARTSDSFERFLGSDRNVNPGALWRKIVDSDFAFSSYSQGRHGHFEFFYCGESSDGKGNKGEILRAILDDDGRRRIQVIPVNQNQRSWMIVDEVWLMVGESSQWELRKLAGWHFRVDDAHFLNNFHWQIDPLEGFSGGIIEFRLASFLTKWADEDILTTNWEAAARCLIADRSSGSTAEIRFRTPHDQRTFGTILSEVHIRSVNDGHIVYRAFIVDRASPLRVNIADVESLPARLQAIDKTDDRTFHGFPHVTTTGGRTAVEKIDAEIGVLACEDPRETRFPESATRFQEVLKLALGFYIKQLSPALDAGGRIANADSFLPTIVNELETAYLSIQAAITANNATADPIIDDPTFFWLGFERTLGPSWAMLFYDMFHKILKSQQISTADKLKLCGTMGEFGPPVWAVTGVGRLAADGPFLQAVLHARWNWVPTEEEIALCQEKLANEWPRPLEHEAAIDSLIRWGRLEDVPEDLLDEWLRTKLAASDMQRHCTWKALTRTPSGRAFLFSQWDALAEKPAIQREVAEIFCHRARATLDMQRFDFMTKQECEKALQLCEPLIK